MNNKDVYSSKKTVNEYRSHEYMPEPEKIIRQIIHNNINIDAMLDLGVGAGRTTEYFAPLFKKYTGVDYSQLMIDVCKKKFNHTSYNFELANAINLASFEDNSFDFVLFSFNGIDCVSIEDRDKVLNEIKRVCRNDGWFAFSVHSIYNVRKLYSFQAPRNPIKYFAAYMRMKKIRAMNPEIQHVEKSDIISLIDGDLDFSTTYVYIKPEFQKKILFEKRFYDIKMFDGKGVDVTNEDFSYWKHQDAWIYYLCRNGK
jgi:ubiquinone/menaquinone biosynthesis C-methylase UbiE